MFVIFAPEQDYITIIFINENNTTMLRKIRIILATVFFALVSMLFLDFTGTVHAWFGWMAKIQFFPAVMAMNIGVIAVVLLLTFLFGRVYCSVICPLGVFQDVVSRLSARRKGKKLRFSYSGAKAWLRYAVLALFVAATFTGLAGLLDPYSAYGRMAQTMFAPLYTWGNNLLAYISERMGSYAFYERDVWLRALSTLILAAVTFVVVAVLAWRSGRTYCNTICPVGTFLGFVSRYSLFRPVIDAGKCSNCSICARGCKASCIDYKNHKIDYSRCVACMDCVDGCRHGALHFELRKKGTSSKTAVETPKKVPDASRRSFLTGAGIILGAAVANARGKTVDGGLAVILDKKIPNRNTPIVPPGAVGLKHLDEHCTGCQLCVAVCPNDVLRPGKLMKPHSSYERGYCRPECTKCSEVCPAGAILEITPAEKSSIQIGHAVWVGKNCLPIADGVECGNCARHCPAGAITMVPSDPQKHNSLKIPVVNEERCIGCGACENLCPARPFGAIYVEGHEQHKTI